MTDAVDSRRNGPVRESVPDADTAVAGIGSSTALATIEAGRSPSR